MAFCLADTTAGSVGQIQQGSLFAGVWLLAGSVLAQKSRLIHPAVACMVHGGDIYLQGNST